MDKERIEKAFREILIAIGEDPDREGLVETPKRVANMYEEIFSGLTENPEKHLKMFREGQSDEIVIVRDIPMYSMCEHHFLPFVGKAHIAYIPNDEGLVIGIVGFGYDNLSVGVQNAQASEQQGLTTAGGNKNIISFQRNAQLCIVVANSFHHNRQSRRRCISQSFLTKILGCIKEFLGSGQIRLADVQMIDGLTFTLCLHRIGMEFPHGGQAAAVCIC